MAFNSRELPVPSATAWGAIVDPTTYVHWLVGAKEIRDIDDAWPAPGSRFYHRVGVGPLQTADHTESVAVDPGTSLTLLVKARPFVKGVVTFRITGEGSRCVVTMEEEPGETRFGDLARPLFDPATHLRNHRSLRNLEAFLLA